MAELVAQLGIGDLPAIHPVDAGVVGDAEVDDDEAAELKKDGAQGERGVPPVQSGGLDLAGDLLLSAGEDRLAAARGARHRDHVRAAATSRNNAMHSDEMRAAGVLPRGRSRPNSSMSRSMSLSRISCRPPTCQ